MYSFRVHEIQSINGWFPFVSQHGNFELSSCSWFSTFGDRFITDKYAGQNSYHSSDAILNFLKRNCDKNCILKMCHGVIEYADEHMGIDFERHGLPTKCLN
jgi:hypothetical protein